MLWDIIIYLFLIKLTSIYFPNYFHQCFRCNKLIHILFIPLPNILDNINYQNCNQCV